MLHDQEEATTKDTKPRKSLYTPRRKVNESVEAKLHDESRLIQRCFDDNKDDDKGDDKRLKGQSKNEFKMFKIESRTLLD